MYFTQIKKTSSGAAAPKDPNVIVIATKDILVWPARNAKKVLMIGDFVLKANPKMAEVYMTASKTKAPYESDGDEDSISLKHKFEGEHPGNELEINEFVADWLGEPCIVIHGSCQDTFRKVVGTKCAPVQLKPAGQDDNDARKHMLVFEQFAKTEWLPGHYLGSTPTATPFAVAAATAVAVNETNGKLYQLPSLAVTASIAFSEIGLNHGDVITLIGGGGAGPATLATGVTDKKAILKDGTSWVALEGAVIHLEVFVNGALTFLIEKSRG
ncbi:hypothetical protein ACMDB5_13090 [Flavobacterium sp. W1B]|uniref:hypothetical protein n=1 Tax=Flavobacterium sp. W1B TaxID=3394146 RepID=UPI0039BD6F9C